jgi:hypothetical protein
VSTDDSKGGILEAFTQVPWERTKKDKVGKVAKAISRGAQTKINALIKLQKMFQKMLKYSEKHMQYLIHEFFSFIHS